MDISDKATEQEELFRNAAIEAARHRAQKQNNVLNYVGYCHYCQEPVDNGKRFCDRFCRDDWEKEQNALV